MREKNTHKEGCVQEGEESLQQFQAVMSSLLSMTRQLLACAGTVDIDVMDNALEERRQLLDRALNLRDIFIQWKHEQCISDQLKQYVMPLVSEIFHADEQLILSVQQRKQDVVEQLARLHRVHNVERYKR
jgi:hypothetical protein